MPAQGGFLRPADADFDSRELIRAQMLDHALDAVVPAGGATGAQPQLAQRQGHVVVNDQNFLGFDLVKLSARLNRLAAQVHERQRLKEIELLMFRKFRLPLGVLIETESPLVGQHVQDHETHVVSGAHVFVTGIAKADDEFDGGEFGCCHERKGRLRSLHSAGENRKLILQ